MRRPRTANRANTILANALLVSVLAAPAIARAQRSAAGPTATDTERYQQALFHFGRGVDFAQESRWRDAIRELEMARDARATPAVYFNLALAYRAVGRNAAAIRSFRDYLHAEGTAIEPSRAADVARYIRDLAAAMGRLRIDLDPPDATLTIDGEPAPADTIWREVDPGPHVLVAQAEGYSTSTRNIEVAPAGSIEIEMRLVAVGRGARLVIDADQPSALIRIDGQTISNGSADEFVQPGLHRVDITAPQRESFHRDVTSLPGTTTRIHAVLAARNGTTSNPWFWIGTAGATAVVAAIVIGLLVVHPVAPVNNVGVGPAVCVGSGC